MSNQTKNPVADQAVSVQLGFEMGVLISGLKVSDDVKEALLILLEQATPKQLIELHKALQQAFLMEATKEVDEQYEQKLRELVKEFEQKETEAETKVIEELTKIESEIKVKDNKILI
ncbi:MAG: hypothetical protein A2388_03185 [Candidatus Veblenbacteria bacterium RIFOXYB1_FULL_43_13]|uniref:Uncharacterized protein n=2 Tax=Candidatus Vebleniibacteriota TaxID=1817921 RepID=A0A1G2Q3G7_9BACT|nr:MAG: hypothetical protein A2226_00215 [Candidatus Veblenbacteria bacterium RIFOXYA2_FULL_43_9]OHA54842.1 MAG: hypothetical protein A2388_03185 [Candidatus Veblenbacteria bacterium RIFOXYB1_FULL_43_13]HAO81333.1 hypothetical protein [Candidatus Veblenbacteria bacterium]HCM45578.1 hypothetical protein [Candidatus Veblenbacteria bacterium]